MSFEKSEWRIFGNRTSYICSRCATLSGDKDIDCQVCGAFDALMAPGGLEGRTTIHAVWLGKLLDRVKKLENPTHITDQDLLIRMEETREKLDDEITELARRIEIAALEGEG